MVPEFKRTVMMLSYPSQQYMKNSPFNVLNFFPTFKKEKYAEIFSLNISLDN